MTETEFNNVINKVIPFINVPKGQIDKANTNVIEFVSFYKKLTGKVIGEGNCKDCILDALFELKTLTPNQLKNLLMEKTYLLRKNRVVGFGGDHYTNANITDAIAFEMVRANRSNAGNFENAELLLSDYDKSLSTKSVHIDLEAFKGVKSASTELLNEKKQVTAPVAGVEKTVSITEKAKQPHVETPVKKVEQKLPVASSAPKPVEKKKKK